jgi:hypothetical protein
LQLFPYFSFLVQNIFLNTFLLLSFFLYSEDEWRTTANVVAFIAYCLLSGMLSSRARLSHLTCSRFITFFVSDQPTVGLTSCKLPCTDVWCNMQDMPCLFRCRGSEINMSFLSVPLHQGYILFSHNFTLRLQQAVKLSLSSRMGVQLLQITLRVPAVPVWHPTKLSWRFVLLLPLIRRILIKHL